MKDTHEMTRLELEIELTKAREIICMLEEKVKQQSFVINTYGTYIDNINSQILERKLVRKK